MSSAILSTNTGITPATTPHYQSGPDRYTLDDLVASIKEHLGEQGGISSEEVDEEYLISLATKYNSNPADWAPYCHNDTSKNYTRNAIENINNKANILLLVWNPGKGSPIHDHANAHCIMKVLAGELCETVYRAPPSSAHDDHESGYGSGGGTDEEQPDKPLQIKSVNTHGLNQVAYISDEIGLHRVHNPSSSRVAVSLHLYTPPNAADYGYNIFDEKTGKACFVPQAKSIPHAQCTQS
ncbi:cysteine dioxygenase [Aspergillus taichungensis]|uniref:Cysteine dioxygenase n=1 Tax=Aspergillus taichungensis TaxID=482145 RepID=A0A2J5I6Y8_9EURO|nr:cysteine dioxygenase [Aspergillus taichungensis]